MKTQATTPVESELNGQSMTEIARWIDSALLGKTYVAVSYRDDTLAMRLHNAITSGNEDAQKRCREAIVLLMRRAFTGRAPKTSYVQELIKLAQYTKTKEVQSTLVRAANAFRKTRNRFDWETNRMILFALLELEEKDNIQCQIEFWKRMFQINPQEFAPAVVGGLIDLDHTALFQIIGKLPNDADLGDVTAINLDCHADQLGKVKRTEFLKRVAETAKESQFEIMKALNTWLAEYKPSAEADAMDARQTEEENGLEKAVIENLAGCCEELKTWKTTGTLPQGVFRKISAEHASNELTTVEYHVVMAALNHTAITYQWIQTVFSTYPA